MAYDHTTIGAERFHFRVRKGIGWFPLAITAREFVTVQRPPNVSGRGYYRLDRDDAKFNLATQATDVAFTGPVAQHLEPAHEAQARLLGVIWSSLTGN